MRRYFTFCRKDNGLRHVVDLKSKWYMPLNQTADAQAQIAVRKAQRALGYVPATQLELVSWCEA